MRVEDCADAVLEPGARHPRNAVEGIGDCRAVRQREIGRQIAWAFETIAKPACWRAETLESVGRIVAVTLRPRGCVGLEQRQAVSEPIAVSVAHRVVVPRAVFTREELIGITVNRGAYRSND